MADEFTYDVFLSHNARNKRRVRRLAERLRDAGLHVWFDEWVIEPGDDIYLAIERGLEAARVQVLCLSSAALASDWVTLERNTVPFRDPANTGRRFIPLLLADCELPDALRRYKYVDFRRETKEAFAELLAACRPETEPTLLVGAAKPVKRSANKRPERVKSLEQEEPLAVLEHKLTGHRNWVYSLAFTSDGKTLVSSSRYEIKLWDFQNSVCHSTITGHSGIIRSVSVTPNDAVLLSASQNDTSTALPAGSRPALRRARIARTKAMGTNPRSSSSSSRTASRGTSCHGRPRRKCWQS